MSLAEYVDVDAFRKEGIITMKYRQPRCPGCNEQRPFDERSFIQKMGCCRPCDIETRPAIYRKGESA
jgi:hypothetical protein